MVNYLPYLFIISITETTFPEAVKQKSWLTYLNKFKIRGGKDMNVFIQCFGRSEFTYKTKATQKKSSI